MRQFIADDWPARLWFWLLPLAAPVAVWWYVAPLHWLLSHWLKMIVFAGILALAWVTGFYASIIPGWLLLGRSPSGKDARTGRRTPPVFVSGC